MKAVLVLGCLLVVAISIAESRNIVKKDFIEHNNKVETKASQTGDLTEELISEVAHWLTTRDAEQDGGVIYLKNLMAQAKRIADIVKVVKARDVNGAVELAKTYLNEYLHKE